MFATSRCERVCDPFDALKLSMKTNRSYPAARRVSTKRSFRRVFLFTTDSASPGRSGTRKTWTQNLDRPRNSLFRRRRGTLGGRTRIPRAFFSTHPCQGQVGERAKSIVFEMYKRDERALGCAVHSSRGVRRARKVAPNRYRVRTPLELTPRNRWKLENSRHRRWF